MYAPELPARLLEKFPDATVAPIVPPYVRDPEPQVTVPARNIVAVCRFLKENDDMSFNMPIQMTAVDLIKENLFELVYHLYSTRKRHAIAVKCRIDRSDPVVDSVTPLWSGMDWQEREVYDLMGISFRNHPNMKRIMMWEGFPGHPLRKDYVHVTDRFDSGLEIGTPGLDAKGIPVEGIAGPHGQ